MAIPHLVAESGYVLSTKSEHGIELSWTGDRGIFPPSQEGSFFRNGDRMWGTNRELQLGDLIEIDPEGDEPDLPRLSQLSPITKIRAV
jgi:hypothetical protein